jgi:hypothetical protein
MFRIHCKHFQGHFLAVRLPVRVEYAGAICETATSLELNQSQESGSYLSRQHRSAGISAREAILNQPAPIDRELSFVVILES